MACTSQLMDNGGWDLELDPGTPRHLLNSIGVGTRLWATYVRTPAHFELGDIDEDDLLGLARFFGVYLQQGQDRLTLAGEGLPWWLGGSGEGGNLYNSTDNTTASVDFAAHIAASITSAANGIGDGVIDTNATGFTFRQEGGDTRREMLDTLCAIAPGGPNFWQVRYEPGTGFVLDADAAATLWATTTTPTAILTEEGGREGAVTGLRAILDLDTIDGSEVRTNVHVDWNDGTSNGTAAASLPATYGNLDSGSPVVETLLDWRPKRPRPPTERWRKVAAWGASNQTRANSLAAREINERTAIREEITASLPDLEDPWRYDITPGNTVWIYDLDRNLLNTANEVYYRGEAVHPTTGRVDEMTVPNHEGAGHYLRCWDGVSAFEWIDLTRYVIPEEGPVELGINQRTRFPVRARKRGLTRKQRRGWYLRAHRAAKRLQRRERRERRQERLEDYYAAVAANNRRNN